MYDHKAKPASEHLLEVKNLTTRFYTEDGIVHAVSGISYTLDEGDTLGVVGESGCGKSVHALSIMRLIPQPPGKIEKGEVFFKGQDLLKLSEDEMRHVRGAEIAMVFQDPMTSLNPVLTIGFQIMEALKLHQGMDNTQARERTAELLDLVGIPEAAQRVDDYPHQFSGGMRQRAMIAMALSCNPSILIADEPTTALDVTIQAQIIDLVGRLQHQLGMTVIWITHDLGVIAGLAHRVNVMYAGRIIEAGPVKDIYGNPHHPYTGGLLGSLPHPDDPPGTTLFSIPGEPPDLLGEQVGCPFAPRCTYKVERCLHEIPPLEELEPGHIVACWEKDKVRKV
ncbi:MAG: ABC transporter ATP-binding protein [Anaerolineae bacterium]|nr:ABC transporter ATP-binding protein [Anaerolineae bacterium]